MRFDTVYSKFACVYKLSPTTAIIALPSHKLGDLGESGVFRVGEQVRLVLG